MPQPSISGMDPPFGDFFQTYTFADQALTSTDLLASNTDPDFMYELDRDMTNRQSPKGDHFTVGDYKEMECGEYLLELVDSDPDYSSNFEQWDTYWEDMTKYTRFTSCDIWGTKEGGLDDFSSPYQDEEVIGQTPTLAQLNSEDSQPPVCDTLYHPDLLMGGQKQHTSLPPLSLGKKMAARPSPSFSASCSNLVRDPLGDFAEGSLSATWPVPSTTETMSKAQGPSKMAALGHHCNDYVRKATVRVSMPRRPLVDMPMASHQIESEDHSPYPSKSPEVATTSGCAAPVAAPATAASASASILAYEKREELPCRVMPPASVGTSGAVPPILHYPVAGAKASETLLTASGSALGHDPVSDKKKEEEHNYSLFLTRARLAGKTLTEMDEEEEEEEVGEMEDEEDAEGVELDEDHDEGFGSEHELSENDDDDDEEDDDDDEEDDDYEGDKDDDMSDTFSEPGSHVSGCDNDTVGDVKGLTAGISRKRGKRRYFWEYSEQLTPSKQERMLKPSEWDRQTLPSNLYQRNGPHHGKYNLKKSRRTDVEDLTPNPRKLLQIGNELRKLNKVISDLTPVSELPITARPRSRKEKNKLASRACRLKKKAQYEANKVKLWGLGTEYDRLLFVINTIKEEMVNRVQDICDKETSMTETLDKLIEETLVKSPVAGETSDFVNQILENTGKGDPTGGLVGLRVPTSRV